MRILFGLIVVLLTFATAKAQNPITKPIDTIKSKDDTLSKPVYINQGKIAGRKAFHRSLIFPGLGQIYNYGLVVNDVKSGAVNGKRVAQKVYIISKIVGMYTGGTLLVMSYGDNRSLYKEVLEELQYRQEFKKPNPLGRFKLYDNTDALNVAKNIYKRNSQIVLITLVGLYGLNALDAYVTARLKYFNITETLTLKVAPSLINSTTMYGFNAAPSLKLTIKL
jgi:hypothetical protein